MAFLVLQDVLIGKIVDQKCHLIGYDNRMHENLFLDEPVLDLEKLEEDFANLMKEILKSDPENMVSLNKVFHCKVNI